MNDTRELTHAEAERLYGWRRWGLGLGIFWREMYIRTPFIPEFRMREQVMRLVGEERYADAMLIAMIYDMQHLKGDCGDPGAVREIDPAVMVDAAIPAKELAERLTSVIKNRGAEIRTRATGWYLEEE